jgi:Tfp pilus assembly protein PilF
MINFLKPTQEQLNSLLECYQTGRYVDAEKLSVSITKEFPKHPFAWKVLAAVLKQMGKMNESLVVCQKSVQLNPQDAEAHNNLGILLQEAQGRLKEAEESCRQAITLKPDFVDAHYNLGNTLKKQGRLDEAEESYTQAITLKPDFVDAHYNLGNTLKEQGRLEEAETNYRKTIALKPDYAEGHNNLGITLQEQGRLEEAETNYMKAIALKPDFAEAHRHLTILKKFHVQDKQYSKMQEIYLDKNISEDQRCHINFGLAKACEDLGDLEKAFQHYREGNELRKKLLKYNINQDIKLFRQIKFNYLRIEQNSLTADKLLKNLIPIFIVGLPRSGTTLVEQIISSHSKVTGAGELNFAAQFGSSIAQGLSDSNRDSLINFREKYLFKLQSVSKGNLIVTDKMPQNFRYIGLLAAAFPEAKIVHVKRNPAAVCWANYKQYFEVKSNGYCNAIDDVISYHKLYENLMVFWTKSLSKRIYNIDYEQLTVNQESETRQLIDYLDLNWDEKCLSPQNNKRNVATASNVQIRKKVYRGSSEQWKKYQPFLNGAFDSLLSP